MEKFRFSFIFLDASKDLEIAAEESDIYSAIIEFAATLAESIDCEKHVINLTFYRRNDQHLWKNIEALVNKYKNKVPQIQQVPQFFKKQTEDEYFFIGYNNDLSQDDLLKVNASLEYLNSGKDYQQTMAEIERTFGGVRQSYNIFAFYGASRKRFYGEKDKTKRVCRFCHQTQATGAKFTMDAHTISESIGNKRIFSYEECDICNDRLGSSVEQDFGEMLRFERCFLGVKGKEGVPVVKGENFTMEHPTGGSIELKIFNEDENDVPEQGDIKLRYITRYNPQNIYRCLVKYALGVIPQEYICHFNDVGDWIRNKKSLPKLPVLKRLMVDNPELQPYLVLYVRKDDNKELPYAVGEFHVLQYIYAFIIPLCDMDDRDFCAKEDFDRFWNHFTHYSSLNNWLNININIDEMVDHRVNMTFGGGKVD